MDAKTVSKDRMTDLLDHLLAYFSIWAPVLDDGVVLFQPIASGAEADLDAPNTKMSPKKLFFPQSEVLFTFDGVDVEEPVPPEEVLLFGVRPCDASSLALLDQVFDVADYPTVYYGRRRESVRVVAMACNQPQSTCFCTDVGGDPFGAIGSDLLISDLGDRYLLEPLTARGQELLADSLMLQGATQADLDARDERARKAREKLVPQVEVEGLKEALDTLFDDPVWQTLHETCLGCGLCTYACPTCHCFDMVDEVEGEQGRRVRIWDSCQYPLFTHHASGHNPRPSGSERMRQRIMHKFHYLVENQGLIGCVGCGRCIRNCPVSYDLREALNVLLEAGGSSS